MSFPYDFLVLTHNPLIYSVVWSRAARQALALAMRLRGQNRMPEARTVAEFSIGLESQLALPEGSVDRCLMQLWRAELSGDLAQLAAVLAKARVLLGAHPWLQAW